MLLVRAVFNPSGHRASVCKMHRKRRKICTLLPLYIFMAAAVWEVSLLTPVPQYYVNISLVFIDHEESCLVETGAAALLTFLLISVVPDVSKVSPASVCRLKAQLGLQHTS